MTIVWKGVIMHYNACIRHLSNLMHCFVEAWSLSMLPVSKQCISKGKWLQYPPKLSDFDSVKSPWKVRTPLSRQSRLSRPGGCDCRQGDDSCDNSSTKNMILNITNNYYCLWRVVKTFIVWLCMETFLRKTMQTIGSQHTCVHGVRHVSIPWTSSFHQG